MIWRFVLFLTLAGRVWACSCTGNWPSVKQAWSQAPFVFLGTVELADPDGDGRQTIFQEQSDRIRVDEAFKGLAAGQIIDLHEGGNDCAAKFRTGQRAVFYLYKDAASGSWYVPPCTHSLGSAAPGGDDLLFLRKLPQSASGTRLSGEVELYEDSPQEAFHRVGGLSGIRVKIAGPGGSSTQTVTNADGGFELYGLPRGRYSASITVPIGLRTGLPITSGSPFIRGNPTAVDLEENGGVSVSFALKADTKLSGRMLDASGKSLVGICVDLEPVEGRGENGARFFDCSKAGGVFEMEMMPPGKYRLIARDEVKIDGFKSKSTLYYPGLRVRDRAMIIAIEAGKYAKHLDIRIPRDEKRYQIAGRMEFNDGTPVPQAGIMVTFASASGYAETAETLADGSFILPVVAGEEGELRGGVLVMTNVLRACPAFKVEPNVLGMFSVMNAKPISVVSDSDHENLKLILPSAPCKDWPVVRR